jgi:molecular chaperone GrpE (heat shock protein)
MNIDAGIYSPFPHTHGYTGGAYSGTGNQKDLDTSESSAVQVRTSQAGSTESGSGSPASSGNGSPTSAQEDTRQTASQTQENPSEESQREGSSQASEAAQQQLTEDELRLVEQLQQIDREVRAHEMAHMAAGGSLVTSAASFTYQRGPDGQNYAVGGEVGIDTSPVPGDPEATARKMRQVRAAALAPGNPSAQDLKVASNAASEIAKAQSELTMLQAKEQAAQAEAQAFGPTSQQAADTYTQVGNLPEEETRTFELAV